MFRVLSLVLDQNIVVVAEGLPDVSVAVTRIPVNSFVAAYAAILGASIERRKYVWFVSRAGQPQADTELLSLGGSKMTIDAIGAHAGEVAALVGLLDDVEPGAACD